MTKTAHRSKKSGRGSPSSVRDASPATQRNSNQDAVLALKSILSVPVRVEKDKKETAQPVDPVLALKAMLSVPVSKEVQSDPVERPKAEAVQALKSLLLSPVKTEEITQSEPASFQALKTMLMSGSKEEVVQEKAGKSKGGSQKRASSPKVISGEKASGKTTPPRSEKKKKQKSAAAGKPAFAGSLFQSSPDPLAMPMPDFDEAQSSFFADAFEDEDEKHSLVGSPSPQHDQLNSLRMMLKVPV